MNLIPVLFVGLVIAFLTGVFGLAFQWSVARVILAVRDLFRRVR